MKRIIFIVVVIILLFIINNLVHSIYSLWQKNDLLVTAQKDLEREKIANQKLHKELSQVKDPQFIEKQARDKLLLVKPGESVVVLPENLIVTVTPKQKNATQQRQNWQLWWESFFH